MRRTYRATLRAWQRSQRAMRQQRLLELCGAGALVWSITSSSPERARVELLGGEAVELTDPSRGLFRVLSLVECDGLCLEGARRVPGTDWCLLRFRSFHGVLLRLLAEVEPVGDAGAIPAAATTGRAIPGPALEERADPRRPPEEHNGGG